MFPMSANLRSSKMRKLCCADSAVRAVVKLVMVCVDVDVDVDVVARGTVDSGVNVRMSMCVLTRQSLLARSG